MVEIIPAIMPDSLDDLRDKAERVAGVAESAQIDVMDGVFVPSVSWPYCEGDGVEWETFRSGETPLPFADTIFYEVDLMVVHPEDSYLEWKQAGVRRIIFHIESIEGNAHEFLAYARAQSGCEIGIALNTETDVALLEPLYALVDVVQCMGIARIGYQGEAFDPRVLMQIARVREHFSGVISVDGSVNRETALHLTRAGATRLVAGSAIFTAPSIAEGIAVIQSTVEN